MLTPEQQVQEAARQDALIDEAMPAEGEFIEFNGMNCDDLPGAECLGWDGRSHRCQCGNRRVYWTVDGNSAYGEAY